MPNEIEIEVKADGLGQVTTGFNDAADGAETLNEQVKDLGEISKKSFKEATDAVDPLRKSMLAFKKEEEARVKEQKAGFARSIKGRKTQIGAIQELRIALVQLKKSRDEAQDIKSIEKFNKKIVEATFELKKLEKAGTEAFDSVSDGAKKAGDDVEKSSGSFGGMAEIAGGIGIAFGAQAIIGNVIDIGKAALDTIIHFRELNLEAGKISGLTGEGLDTIVVKAEAIAETFDGDVLVVLQTAKDLSDEFGISQEVALEKIASGAIGVRGGLDAITSGADNFRRQIASAGGSVDDLFLTINSQSATVVQEFGIRIKKQTKESREALNTAFGGEFTSKLFDGINDGTITSVEGLKLVSEELKNSEIPASELQKVVSTLFGKQGEKRGLEFIQSLSVIGGSVEDLTAQESELAKEQREILEANEELAKSQVELSRLFDGLQDPTFFTNLKTIGFELLTDFLEPFIALIETTKESFDPLLVAIKELRGDVDDTTEGFSLLDGALIPIKISLEVIGFIASVLGSVLTTIVNGVKDFLDISPNLTEAFREIGEFVDIAIEAILQFKDLITSGFDAAAAAGKTAARRIDEEFTQPLLKQLNEIDKVERDLLKQKLIRDQIEIKSKLDKLAADDLLLTAAGQQLIEFAKANNLVLDEIKRREAEEANLVREGENEITKVRAVKDKEALAAAKKAAEKRLKELEKLQAEFLKTIERLANESDKIQLENLEGPERFAKIRENALNEIQILEDTITEKGRLFQEERTRDIEIRKGRSKEQIEAAVKEAGDLFELTKEQQEQLTILRNEARATELEALAKFNNDKALAQIDGEQKSLDIQEAFAINSLRDLENNGMSEIDFVLFKEEEELRVQQEFAEKRIKLLEDEIKAKEEIFKADGSISIQEQNQLDSLNLQKENLENFIEDTQKERDRLEGERGKFNLAEFLGIDPDDLPEVLEAINTVVSGLVDGLNDVLSAQAEAADIRLEQLEEQEDAVRDELDTEIALNEAGFAANVAGKQAELAEIKKAKIKAQKDAADIAKKQLILDTTLQAVGLITTSINIIEGFSKIPIIGLPLGIAAVGAMLAFFISAKQKAFAAVGSTPATAEKGATGQGSTGVVTGKRHYRGGEFALKHLQVEEGEPWAVLSRDAGKKGGDKFIKFAEGLNMGQHPDDIMRDLLDGTGIYMKKDIDTKIINREVVIRHQEIIMLASATNEAMEQSMSNIDDNTAALLKFTKNNKQFIKTHQGWLVYDPKLNKTTHVKDISNGPGE